MACYQIKSANQNGARDPWAIALTRAAVSKTKLLHKLKQNYHYTRTLAYMNDKSRDNQNDYDRLKRQTVLDQICLS